MAVVEGTALTDAVPLLLLGVMSAMLTTQGTYGSTQTLTTLMGDTFGSGTGSGRAEAMPARRATTVKNLILTGREIG